MNSGMYAELEHEYPVLEMTSELLNLALGYNGGFPIPAGVALIHPRLNIERFKVKGVFFL